MKLRSLCYFSLAAAAFLPLVAQQQQAIPPTQTNTQNYRRVAPQPQTPPPCGHVGTAPCETGPAAVTIPPGATADQIFDLGMAAYGQRKFSIASGYMEKAAAMGHTRAQASLGLDFVNAKGEPKDLKKAVYWLTLAADKGHKTAQAQLGDLYEDGDGVEQDVTKAFHYHSLSAAQRWWQAELRLGLEYELGYGTPHNRATALMWLDRATSDGKDGLSQNMAVMLRRSDTPARFNDMNALAGYLGKLLGQAYEDSLPKFPPGKNCKEHYPTGLYFCT